jgi:hypothetical protein
MPLYTLNPPCLSRATTTIAGGASGSAYVAVGCSSLVLPRAARGIAAASKLLSRDAPSPL